MNLSQGNFATNVVRAEEARKLACGHVFMFVVGVPISIQKYVY
jgi:hypothetical protein